MPLTPSLSSVTALLADNYAPIEQQSDWYCDNKDCDGKPHEGWNFKHCRWNQRPPENDWFVWILMSGRGFGKSRTAAEWMLREASRHPRTEWAVVAPTGLDVSKCFNDLRVGINSIGKYGQPGSLIAKYNQTLHDATLTNGAVIHGVSADKPDRLRGFNLAGAWCVAEGELVTTRRGNIPIEHVTTDDYVATRQGWRRVVAQRMTGIDQPIIKINTQDGLSLRCTPNHKILANGVWCEAANLQSGDVLTTWMEHSLTDLPLGGSGKDSGGITTPRWGVTADPLDSCWRSRFGAGITDPSQMDKKSITSTKINLTTVWKTWQSWICTNIAAIMDPLTGPREQLQLAMRVPTQCGLNERPNTAFALNVGKTTRVDPLTPATVVSAVAFERAIVANVSDLKFRSNVYDLTIEDAHEFFVNGILVHNCDELSSWRYPDSWDLGLLPAIRDDSVDPRIVVTTTPKPVMLLRRLIEEEQVDADGIPMGSTVVTRGSTFDNQDNLAPRFIQEMRTRYEGTLRGRQELYGELLTGSEGALITQDMIDATRLREKPNIVMVRTVVAVDPAMTSGENSDETGIVVCARGIDGRGYVLADLSCKLSPDGWARVVAKAYDDWQADRVVAEKNQGFDMVESIVRSVHPNIAYKGVHASQGKKLRAEPIAALYEQGKVSHVGVFDSLEDQWTNWIPDAKGQKSPDRVDALVHGLTELGLVGLPGVHVFEAFQNEHPPCQSCSQPAPRGTPFCPKCGAQRHDEMPELATPAATQDSQPWSLTYNPPSTLAPNPQVEAVQQMLQELQGPQNRWNR